MNLSKRCYQTPVLDPIPRTKHTRMRLITLLTTSTLKQKGDNEDTRDDDQNVYVESSKMAELAPAADHTTEHTPQMSRGGRIARTVALMLSWFGIGASTATYGAVLVTLEIILDVDTKTISSAYTSRALGFLFGSITCGLVYRRINTELLFGLMMLGVALTTTLIPNSGYWYVLHIISLFNGFFRAVPDAGGNTYLLYLWGNHKAKKPLLQAVHSIWSIGTTFSPFIIAPFLVDISGYLVLPVNETVCGNLSTRESNSSLLISLDDILHLDDKLSNIGQKVLNTTEESVENSTNFLDTIYTIDNTELYEVTLSPVWGRDRFDYRECLNNISLWDNIQRSQLVTQIQVPFLIIGAVVFCTSLFFFMLFFYEQPRCAATYTGETRARSGSSTDTQTKWFRIQMLTIMFVFFVFYVILEAVPGRFVAMFVVKGLGWKNKDGALITSLYWGSSGVGKLFGIFLSIKLKPRTMLLTDLAICTLGVVILWFSPIHPVIPWLGTGILGCGMATVFASVVLWVDEYLEVTGTASSVFLTGASCGSMAAPVLTGIFFQDYGYMWFVYILFGTNCLLILNYIIALIRAMRHGKRNLIRSESHNYKSDQEEMQSLNELETRHDQINIS